MTAEVLDAGTGIGSGRRLESHDGGVTFRVARLEPDAFTNAIARFRLRVSPNISADDRTHLYGYVRERLPTVSLELTAIVKNSMDTNDANDEAKQLVGIYPPKKK
jgi:hypothetical protein